MIDEGRKGNKADGVAEQSTPQARAPTQGESAEYLAPSPTSQDELDAWRYRWLCANASGNGLVIATDTGYGEGYPILSGNKKELIDSEVDAAIDRAK